MKIIHTSIILLSTIFLAAPSTVSAYGAAKLQLALTPSWNDNKPSLKDVGKAAMAQGNEVKGQLDGPLKTLKAIDDLQKMQKNLDTLTNDDKRMEPDYKPPGTPDVPSKCLENKACRPCYTEAYGKVNTTRKNLEKVRAKYEFTHRFTTQGIAYMQAAGNAGGGIAAMGAQAEVNKVNESLSGFDEAVRSKNSELLGKLEGNLREVGICEAKYYKNDDWYDRYGYMYYQFMQAHYAYSN